MGRSFTILAALTLATAGLSVPLFGQHSYIANGDFSVLDPGSPLFESWTNNAGVTLAQQPIVADHAARIALNTANLGNALSPVRHDSYANLTTYTFSFQFAASDPGSSTARSLQVSLRTVTGSEGGNINLRLVGGSEPGMGTLEVFDGGWQTALANAVSLSSAETGEGFAVNTVTIAGDYTAATPVYTIEANGTVSPELSFFQNSRPAQGTPLAEITFQSGNLAAGAWAVIDNVSLEGPVPPDTDPGDPGDDPDPDPQDRDYLANGDFEILDEEAPLFEYWSNTSSIQLAATPISGENSAKLVHQTAGLLHQVLYDPNGELSNWSVSFDVAMADPGPPAARSFQLNLPHGGGNINLRVIQGSTPGIGTIQFFSGVVFAGGAWVAGMEDAVNFSTSESDLQVNSFQLSGDYSGSAPSFTLTVNGQTRTGITAWQDSPPAAGSRITQVRFETGNYADHPDVWAVIDNIEVVRSGPGPARFLQLFWTETDLGEIHTAYDDGSNRGALLTGLFRPLSIKIDQENEYVYWTEEGLTPGSSGDGLIGRARLDGTEATVLYAAAAGDAGLGNPQQMAIDAEGGFLYWADLDTGIYRAPIDGSGPVQLLFSDGWGTFGPLTLDLNAGHLYFAQTFMNQLYRIDLDGGNQAQGPADLSAAFHDLVIDPESTRLYFPDTDALRSYTLGGTAQTVASGLASPTGIALSPDHSQLYFTERGAEPRISVVGANGAALSPVLTGLDNPFGLAVIEIEVVAGGFEQWRQAQFTAEELGDEAISGPAASPAGDGLQNLLKYAFGLPAKVPAREGLPFAEMVAGELLLTYPLAKDATDVELVVEVSSDLLTWESGEALTEVIGVEDAEAVELVTVRLLQPLAGAPRAFLRVVVRLAE